MEFILKLTNLIKKLSLLFILIILSSSFSWTTELNLGFNLGYRELKDPDLEEVYGDGYVYKPYLRYFPHQIWGVEISYEGGYRREARVGLFQEESTLSVSGFQFCSLFRYRIKLWEPYFKLGVGYFSYQQDIESQFVRRRVDHHEWTTVVGGGTKFKIYRMLSFMAEVEYIPLRVKPFEIEVDLGGLRYLLGLSLNFYL